ncbi:MAG TPA: class I SAM-dependent methyltransferase [Caldilineae bacterium]|nr:class I SAM-dependent methyltransferase [Caldilineae bacterium]
MLTRQQDAFGQAMYDYLHRGDGFEIIERDDGFFSVGGGPQTYFIPHGQWPAHQREAIRHARGRVLDVGCGAGRHALYLQERGLEVVGIDISPRAIEVCKRRGLRHAHVLSVTRVSRRLGIFDTIIMMGNNLGLLGNPKRARWLLRRFRAMTSCEARIIGESRDPYVTETPEHLEYHEFNRKRGRLPGQLRIRVRYKKLVTPWYLLFSQDELKGIIQGTGWEVETFIDGEAGMYVAILRKVA